MEGELKYHERSEECKNKRESGFCPRALPVSRRCSQATGAEKELHCPRRLVRLQRAVRDARRIFFSPWKLKEDKGSHFCRGLAIWAREKMCVNNVPKPWWDRELERRK